MAVAPNPEYAAFLRGLNLPPNLAGWRRLRDHSLKVAENGLADGESLAQIDNLLDAIVAASYDSMQVALNLDARLKALGG